MSATLPSGLAAGSSKKGIDGLIFMCNSDTIQECFRYKVFGLPIARINVVKQVTPGTLLFLYNISRRLLYGIYKAVSPGGLNLEPEAFRSAKGSYPAQVRFDTYRHCLPLSEEDFQDAIKENYIGTHKFDIILNASQIEKLEKLFRPIESGNIKARSPVPVVKRPVSTALGTAALGGATTSVLPVKRQLMGGTLLPAGNLERPESGLLNNVQVSRLPQVRTLDVSNGLLQQSRMDEVDQLALKYLKRANPNVNHLIPRSLLPQSALLNTEPKDLYLLGTGSGARILPESALLNREPKDLRLLGALPASLAARAVPALAQPAISPVIHGVGGGLARRLSGPYAPVERR